MSSLWTPSGEHPVDDRGRQAPDQAPERPPDHGGGPPRDEEAAEAVEELRRQLADAPAEIVVANHCYGLFELAAIYLSQEPPLLEPGQLAIDAMGAVVDGLAGRLGEPEPALKDALAQIRMAFVQVQAAEQARQDVANGADQA